MTSYNYIQFSYAKQLHTLFLVAELHFEGNARLQLRFVARFLVLPKGKPKKQRNTQAKFFICWTQKKTLLASLRCNRAFPSTLRSTTRNRVCKFKSFPCLCLFYVKHFWTYSLKKKRNVTSLVFFDVRTATVRVENRATYTVRTATVNRANVRAQCMRCKPPGRWKPNELV